MNLGSCAWDGLRVTRPHLERGGETRWREIQLASTRGPRGWVQLVDLRSKRQYVGLPCSRRGDCRTRSASERLGRGDSGLKMATASFGLDLVGISSSRRSRLNSERKVRDARLSVFCAAGRKSSSTMESGGRVDSGNAMMEEDFITKLLTETPSQVEQKYKIGDRFYTLREKTILQRPLWKKVALAISSQLQTKPRESSKESAETGSKIGSAVDEASSETRLRPEADEAASPSGSVYLPDLLRRYKGNLFIPEEAFEDRTSGLDEFNRNLDTLPEMTFEDCWNNLKGDQIKLLTSRGVPSPTGGYVYWDFVVELKEAPGEKELQQRKWALHFSDDEARVLLREYTGPQIEVETTYTPYVMRPTQFPHPIASSISARLVTELGVIVGIMSALGVAAGGIAVTVTSSIVGTGRYFVVHIVWPLVYPILRPFATLVVNTAGGTWNVVVAVASGQRGPGWLVSEGYRLWKTGVLFSSARTLGAILFVLIAMAALAKFTLTRRPKDFTKWDLWQAIEFGHSKPQARVEGTTGVGFADVAGIDDVVQELQELVSYLKDPERFNRMGTKPPHGVLLEGPPGCGKTLLAKAIAGEAGVPFYQMAGSEFVEVLVGVGAARVRDLFKRAKVNKPSVVFIDEIDALGAIRHGAAGDEGMESYNAGAQERETTLNQLLIELDGFDTGEGVVFLGATNRMDMLDPALLRPGRFDRKVAIRPPRAKGRLEILRVHAKSVKLDDSVDLWIYAKNLPGWSGAELAQLLQEAALVAVRHGGTVIMRQDMDQALDRLTMGPVRLGLERRQPVHRRMAAHEVGLAMTSHLLRRLENAELEFADRVSIVPRGETLARTIFDKLDDEAYLFERRPTLIHRMQVMLGGRAAEEVMYGQDTSTLSVQYLPDASWLARKLVSIWNLDGEMAIQGDATPWQQSESFSGPPLNFEGSLYNNYGFNDNILNYDLVDNVAHRTKVLLDQTYEQTLGLLKRHEAALTKAVYVVMEKEELFGEELEIILDRYPSSMSPELVEGESDPGALPSEEGSRKKEVAAESSSVALRLNSETSSSNEEAEEGMLLHTRSEGVDKWSLGEVRSMEESQASLEITGLYAGDDDDIQNQRWMDTQVSKPNGIVETQKKEAVPDRGESWRSSHNTSSLEGGDIAATNRAGFGESPDATKSPSVSLSGKTDIHD